VAKPASKITWKDILPGAVVDEPGSAAEYLTGDWRSTRPEIDYDVCIKCGICWLFCPDAAMNRLENKQPRVNLDYCKGCGICAEECPVDAIEMSREVK